MLSKKEKDLIEKVVTGGGATGQAMSADPTGTVAQAPGNSKKQGDSMQKPQNPAGTDIEETDPANNTAPTGDNSKQNAASVSMKEELAGVFGDDLSEEAFEKIATIFEAAVALKVAEIEADYYACLDAEVDEIKEELTEQVDKYLSYAAQEWLAENEVAVESSLKNELTEEFINGLKSLFAEHYIEVPSQKVDILEALALKVEELEATVNEQLNENIELRNELTRHDMSKVFDSVTEGLALSQVEKFRSIVESIEFPGDLDKFKSKLETIKEHYFSGKPASHSNILTEEFEGEVDSAKPAVTGEMSHYVTAISRTLKK